MPRPPWVDFGLAWASGSTLVAQGRIARALLRWDVLAPPSRAALRKLVLDLEQPPAEAADDLASVQLVSRDEKGRCLPLYPGVGLIALDHERRGLEAAQAQALLSWYRRGLLRVRRTYDVFCSERPRGAHETGLAGQARPGFIAAAFAALERRSLIEHRQGYVYRSTVRGWAVARLVEDATPIFVDEDGPTQPRLRLPLPGVGTP